MVEGTRSNQPALAESVANLGVDSANNKEKKKKKATKKNWVGKGEEMGDWKSTKNKHLRHNLRLQHLSHLLV